MSAAAADAIDDEEADAAPIATLRRGLALLPEFRATLPITFFLAAVGSIGRVAVPLVIGRAVDRGFKKGAINVDLIVRYALAALVVTLLTQFCTQYGRYRLQVDAEKALAQLRRYAVSRVLRLSTNQHTQTQRGVLVARITSDVETLSRFFGWGAIAWVLDIALLLIVTIVMLFTEWRLTLVVIAVSSPCLFAVRMLQRKLNGIYQELRGHIGTYLGRVAELVASAHLVRAYNAQASLGGATKDAIEARRITARRAGVRSASLIVGSEAISTLALLASVVVAIRIGQGPAGLTAGAVISFLLLVTRFFEPILDLVENVDQTQVAASGLERVLALLDTPLDVAPPTASQPLPLGQLGVELDHVTFTYPTRERISQDEGRGEGRDEGRDEPQTEGFALRDLSLTIEPGTTVAVVGATGSGKSTLARLIVRLADPTAGEVRIGGVPISDVDPENLRSRVQLVPQEPFLFSDTIEANVRLAISNAGAVSSDALSKRVDELLRGVGLGEWLDSLPDGVNTHVGERGGLLSAGERQLVALARTQAANPDVLLLDEATSSVDAATEARLSSAFDAIRANRTVVVIAHRLNTVARADHLVVLENGVIVEQGRPAELAAVPGGHYAELVAAWERATA